jgi:hypothetical protein
MADKYGYGSDMEGPHMPGISTHVLRMQKIMKEAQDFVPNLLADTINRSEERSQNGGTPEEAVARTHRDFYGKNNGR